MAITHIHSPLLVLAGAGSGKTRVITQKIIHLIENEKIPANRIVALTFTNKAAREMLKRIHASFDRHKTKGLTISTFHTFGLGIIKKEHQALGLRKNFSLFDEDDAKTLINELMGKYYPSLQSVDVMRIISRWKNALIAPEEAPLNCETKLEAASAEIYAQYERHLRAYSAVDFDDLISLPVKLFKQTSDILEKWQNKIHYLLVDEYQDTNFVQYQLIRTIMSIRQKMTLVGDDDQSIYAWRGAEAEQFKKLQVDFTTLSIIKLEQNYRSTGRILKAANHLIANNPHVIEKKLWSQMGYGDAIRVMICDNEHHEAEKITSDILDQKIRLGKKLGGIAILYRSNYQARLIELQCQALQIPYQVSGGTSFFARQEIKDVIAYLRLMINPDDDNAFLRIINVPKREIGASTLETLGLYAQKRKLSLLCASGELGLQQTLNEKSAWRLKQFADWLELMRKTCGETPSIESIQQILKDIQYDDYIESEASHAKQAEKKKENVQQLMSSIAFWLKQEEEKNPHQQDEIISKVINKLILRDLLDQKEQEANPNSVSLMTLHAAKGLEFPIVYILGVEENLIPHKNSIDSGTLEEERRLFYVGITRAQQNLILSYSMSRRIQGNKIEIEPSRFLDELPEDDLEWEGQQEEKTPEARQNFGLQHLDKMREMLNGLN